MLRQDLQAYSDKMTERIIEEYKIGELGKVVIYANSEIYRGEISLLTNGNGTVSDKELETLRRKLSNEVINYFSRKKAEYQSIVDKINETSVQIKKSGIEIFLSKNHQTLQNKNAEGGN